MLGSALGPWRLVGEIARGGMGVVYRAVRDDASFRKEAAVKVLPAGVWDTQALARFRSERSILAQLEHPSIARLLDGGTAPDGRPYYVMDLVEGEWIDRYCESRGLVARERLEIFATVCDAVHYAHQNLVLHRDLKPANILVAADGTPHLLDFGIAKLLDPEGGPAKDVTATEFRALTPRYASPEQVTGAALTTASDVYSLGVLLYELAGRCAALRDPNPIARGAGARRLSAGARAAQYGHASRPAGGSPDQPGARPASSRTTLPDPDAPTVTGLGRPRPGPARPVRRRRGRPRLDRPEDPPQGAGASLRLGKRAGRGHPPAPRGPARPRPAGHGGLSPGQVRAASPGGERGRAGRAGRRHRGPGREPLAVAAGRGRARGVRAALRGRAAAGR